MSADIDGMVSAMMLGSVAPGFEIAAFSVLSGTWLVHPGAVGNLPNDAFGVDVFSTRFDTVSNHVLKWGSKKPKAAGVAGAFAHWDAAVDAAAARLLVASPTVWAGTQAGYEDDSKITSARYKYPLGTAQLLLAMLEASGNAPRFYDRTYLPWLVANCDGGVKTYVPFSYNTRVWWPVLAGAVGPGSLTDHIYSLVDEMRPNDFLDAVHRLDRERPHGEPPWLNDAWKLSSPTLPVVKRALRWMADLTGWRDPVRGGIDGLDTWLEIPATSSAQVYHGGKTPAAKAMAAHAGSWVKTADDPALAVQLIQNGVGAALNANFMVGGQSGSRFNWVGGW
ncbi:hypothetical protein [Cellulomonas xylanilytica]|uniref:hypothetical protein n=1 Tax=Cellulomonas xylanilytica TaxID=233583 RepID=UPI0011BD59CB|nr:hypothetical protein [Cellulomonas xylanilytica]